MDTSALGPGGIRVAPWVRLQRERADANRLLKVFEIPYPPVNVHAIADRMGIAILPETSTDSGRIDADARTGVATIRVRQDHVPWRQRFTIAHEIGHLLLHHTHAKTCFRDVAFSGTSEEVAANRFAADLLMPLWMLEPLALTHGADGAMLARIFEVSREAMDIRLSVLTGIRR
jgi:Zn-dependent peptidase ImmA (M78 family)